MATAHRTAWTAHGIMVTKGDKYPDDGAIVENYPGLFQPGRIDESGAGAPPDRNATNDEWRGWAPARRVIGDDIDGMGRKAIIARLEEEGVLRDPGDDRDGGDGDGNGD